MYVRCITFVLIIICALAQSGRVAAENHFPGAEWEHVTPVESGWSQAELARARAFSDEIRSSAVMIVQHGKVVAEWGNTTKRTELASVRKSLLSALIGIAVTEHLIKLDSTVGELGIDDNPPNLTEAEKGATVRQLLQARSGIYHSALYETPAMAAQRPPRGSHAPGAFWYYNNWDFNALGSIYERATGVGIFEAFDRLIARPIGMQEYRAKDGVYFRGKDSIHPAYPIRMSARDLARFGLLYLHKGNWAGKQIVPRDWVEESTRSYSNSGFGSGYGYLWWTGFLDGSFAPTVKLPEDSISARGAGGQYAFVIPSLDLVVVHRVDRDLVNSVPEPSARNIARLLWLILKAGGYDPGPDASIATATGDRPAGDELTKRVESKTFSFGAKAKGGPFEIRLEPEGGLTYLRWDRSLGPETGTWTVEGEQLCLLRAVSRCYLPVLSGESMQLFDEYGVMQLDATARTQ